MDILTETVYWAVFISLGSYIIFTNLQNKMKCFLLNPLLFSTILTIIFLLVCKIDYEIYFEKIDFLYYLLTPATVCLAIPLYKQIEILKKNFKAIIIGIMAGVFSGLGSVLLLSILFGFSRIMYLSILPKSVTAAIAVEISEEIGGISSLTIPVVIMTGITGHILAEKICKIFRITEPIAKGIAIGSSSHIMGTAKAIEMGEIEGAMSSLAVTITGIITVIGVSFFSHL